jgi:hypothetical protein
MSIVNNIVMSKVYHLYKKLYGYTIATTCLLMLFIVIIQDAAATGMAVALNNLNLVNNTKYTLTIKAPNITADARVILPPHSSCKLEQPVMFMPNLVANSNDFYVLFETWGASNPIIINPLNHLNLLDQTKYKNSFSLYAMCNGNHNQDSNKDNQPKFFATPINTVILSPDNQAPQLAPRSCPDNYNYLYIFGATKDVRNLVANTSTPCKIDK